MRVSLDHADWKYELDQPAKFSIAVTLNNSKIAGLPLKYSCGPEAMPPVIRKDGDDYTAPKRLLFGW